ncbi:Deoxyribodipyrimidine photo-lyase [Nitrospira japonica]|uniref:Deoxyribodipyrimidine photo-lyase n=1 Tax=Nitrospira japonica TaxID=1325564 RepID=A0A1W1I386_9BACT|nr:deoxyribodipyrimidine photo-lyase [Nitrospira japonica]SLM47454.1 Deoxyribodipyrimidine photo-lyase [Nitrospira japonica]
MRGVVWFRRDLRLADQPALTAACEECDEIIPLFVFDEPLLQSRAFGDACVNFMLGCLDDLAERLASLGVPLRWRRGDPAVEVPSAVLEWKADAVYWNRDYEPAAIFRDRTVEVELMQRGVQVRSFKDHVIFEADEVQSATGGPLQRYGAYRARWWTKWQAAKPAILPVPKTLSSRGAQCPVSCPVIPSPDILGYDRVPVRIEPGERNAVKRLRRFVKGPLHRYAAGRNRPAIDGSSMLSPHFRFGTLSARTAVRAALDSLTGSGPVSRADVVTWIDELIWREFFQQVLAAFPHVAEGPFRETSAPPARQPGQERDRLYRAWCEGRTGYPIVDAGMRQLNETGWMHNRVRMITASFMIKDLRLDWRSGERYFMRQLIDADVAANNGNWQWCASTGTDAMRGYRIFNPALQSKKFDSDGVYIRTYVPELDRVSSAHIHEPHLMTLEAQRRAGCRIGYDYPAPIVDHGQARREYLDLAKRRVAQ